eukprot:6631466-Ditylum_brightwellii.AAC.1
MGTLEEVEVGDLIKVEYTSLGGLGVKEVSCLAHISKQQKSASQKNAGHRAGQDAELTKMM